MRLLYSELNGRKMIEQYLRQQRTKALKTSRSQLICDLQHLVHSNKLNPAIQLFAVIIPNERAVLHPSEECYCCDVVFVANLSLQVEKRQWR